MAECKWPGGCKEGPKGKPAQAVAKSTFCDKHRRKQQEEEKLKREKEKAAKELEVRKEAQEEMARKAKEKEEKAAAKKKKIAEIANNWKGQVEHVAAQVRKLRHDHPGQNINAGHNTAGNTDGGVNNPLELKLPSDAGTMGITKGDVLSQMANFDSSDSGHAKFRFNDPAGNILVHIH